MTDYTIQECRDAKRACARLAQEATSRVMRAYWQRAADDWQARLREAERLTPRTSPSLSQAPCPSPTHWGGDELRCNGCGIQWGATEPHPECPLKGQVGNSNA